MSMRNLKLMSIVLLLTVTPIAVVAAHGWASSRFLQAEGTSLGWMDSVRQTLPVSCGPALLASMANRGQANFTELKLLAISEIQETGISLAEFRRLADHIGWPGNWFAGSSRHLRSMSLPIAVHLIRPDNHFAMIHEILADQITLEDPVAGYVTLSLPAFEARWSGFYYANQIR